MGKVLKISELPSIIEKFSLKGKKAFVTGAAGGIGRSSAAAMAELGADVAIMDIQPKEQQLKECAKDISERYGIRVLPIVGDVSDEASVIKMYDEIVKEFGTIDIVHSNAGIGTMDDNCDISLESWNKMLAVNQTGMLLIARTGANIMKEHGHGGSIIITASMSASIVNKFPANNLTMVAYTATKAAVEHMTKALAINYVEHGIRINSISPGYILSGLHDQLPKEFLDFTSSTVPMQRYGTLDEIVGVIALLATDLSSYMTGSDVIADGGYTIW
ncbi:SDR family oxidoreductase [Clostridium sediminicola]|uniref:SDR family oxidoreductase n=1 Tax=Clostridium sediminicola TaxID=3114879 RepID=UPI0031F1E5C9